VPDGITTLLLLTLVFGSLNLLGVGIVGEYVSRVLIETKQRPRLIRSELIRSGESFKFMTANSASEDRK